MKYLSNAFSLQMVEIPSTVTFTEISESTFFNEIVPAVNAGQIKSAIGHQDTANILGVPCDRCNVSLRDGDILYVAQVIGGRLPEGCTQLPDGITLKFIKVVLI